jgi:hypothetical protein
MMSRTFWALSAMAALLYPLGWNPSEIYQTFMARVT